MKRVLAMPFATSFGMALAGTAYAQTAQVTPKAPPGARWSRSPRRNAPARDRTPKEEPTIVVAAVKSMKRQEDRRDRAQEQGLFARPRGERRITGDIAVGQKVKVTYSKSDGGQKVTTVAPDEGNESHSK